MHVGYHWPFTYSALSSVNTHLRCKIVKEIVTSKNFLAKFVLALHVVFKKYLFIPNISKVSFRGGQTIDCDLPVNCASCLVNHSRILVSNKIYFAPQ